MQPRGRPPPPPAWFLAATAQANGPLPVIPPYARSYPPPQFADPDKIWLEKFSLRHLGSSEQPTPLTITSFRHVREKIAWEKKTIEECKALQSDLERLAKTILHSDDEHAKARAKLQWDRRNSLLDHRMQQLREFDQNFFGNDELHAKAVRLAKQVTKKKKYRQEQRKRLKAQVVISKGLCKVEEPPVLTQSSENPVTASATQATNSDTMKNEALARRLQLLLELKKQRDPSAWTDQDQKAKELAIETLAERESKLAARQTEKSLSNEPTQSITPAKPPPEKAVHPLYESQMTMESLVSVRYAWDSYLVYDGKGSRIPPHMVDPPEMPTEPWQMFLVNARATST